MALARALALAALAALAAAAPAPAALDLSGGAAWTLTNGAGNVSLAELSLPKYALEALVDAGILGDPLWRCVGNGKGDLGRRARVW